MPIIGVGMRSKVFNLAVSIGKGRLWTPESPNLYDLQLSVVTHDAKILDTVNSYFGMRKISLGKDERSSKPKRRAGSD